MSPSRRVWLAIVSFLTDPPGWIPAWAMTALYLILLWRGAESPQALLAADNLSKTLGITLAIWLGYKGWRALLPELMEIFGRKAKPKAEGE